MTRRLMRLARGNRVLTSAQAAIAVALLMPLLERPAYGQTDDERTGFIVRELSLSTGYLDLQLPPVTLGGRLPEAVLDEDLVTSGTVGIDWRRVTPRTRYTFDLFGAYTARTRYARLSAPVADLTFGVSRAVGTKWRLGAAAATGVTGADQLALQPTPARRLVDGAETFADLAGAAARSPAPDPTQAALFLPINQSLVESDLYRHHTMTASGRAEATYAHSARLATYFRGSYTIARPISNGDRSRALPPPASNAHGAGVGFRYDRTERTTVSVALDWSLTSGTVVDEIVLATVEYAWSGRKWFTETSGGAALRPFRIPVDAALTTSPHRPPEIVYSATVGYKFQAHTMLVGYSRLPHDEYGHGGRNVTTGFEGNVQSVAGAWSWWAPRGRWMARADVSMVRRPGNFSYINAWLMTTGIGRELTRNVRVMGELLFDRHGSRGFEGFHLTREGARVTFTWTPQRRHREEPLTDQRSESDR